MFFTYDFFCINFLNVKIDCMCVEYNGVSLIGGNCKNSPMNIMLIPPNGKICIVICKREYICEM